MPPLSEFHLFPELPTEIRLKVWKLVLSTPRTVHINCKRRNAPGERRSAQTFYSTTPPPALLHICQESRFEALKIYHESFATKHAPNVLYISFAQDTIRCPDNLLQYVGKPEIEAVRQMTLEVSDASYFGHFYIETLRAMTNLERLELLTQERESDSWNRGGRFVEKLKRDFVQERYEYLGWECPRVIILNSMTGDELGVIEGGAIVPGWQVGDERPEIPEQ